MCISVWSSDVCSSDLRQRGEIDIDDRERLAGALRGALAATSQVTGIAYFSAQGWSLRVGRGDHGPLRLFDPHEPDADSGRLVQAIKAGSGPIWEGIFWVTTQIGRASVTERKCQ